jgi:hypothetical protein
MRKVGLAMSAQTEFNRLVLSKLCSDAIECLLAARREDPEVA